MKIIKIAAVFATVLIGVGLGYFLSGNENSSFESLTSKEMQETITTQRDLAIQKAVDEGNYECCINPPCTMCFMQANKWNNFEAGKCFCDDVIAKGEDPCPQCINGLCESDQESSCEVIN